MNEYAQVANTVSRMFACVDALDWDGAKGTMAESIYVDYSSYSGQAPAQMQSGNLIEQWAIILPHFDSVHHQIGNLIIEVSESHADVRCHGTAHHYIEDLESDNVQCVIGTYDFELTRDDQAWKIMSMRFNFKFVSGNPEVSAKAQRRAAAQKAS